MEHLVDEAFEARLEAMFADPPPAPDEAAFAARLERRLAREARRRLTVTAWSLAGGLGAAGAVLAASIAARAGQGMDLGWLVQAGPVIAGAALLWGISEFTTSLSRA